jgi:hypothetical protein
MKFKKSRSLNGDNIVWVARTGKGGAVVARADSEEELDKVLAGFKKVELSEDKPTKDESASTKSHNPLRLRKSKG